jgi:hypothetical protein
MNSTLAWAHATLIPKKKDEVFVSGNPLATFAHKDDFAVCELVKASLSEGPWIAGGAALSWYNRLPTLENDIDVFCKDADQANHVVRLLNTESNATMICQTANAKTFELYEYNTNKNARRKLNGRKKVQVITCKYFDSAQEVIDDFDITVCQIVTNGLRYITGKDTIRHIKNKELAFTKFTPNSMRRYVKYSAYGYTPSAETLAELVKFYSDNPTKYTTMDDQYDHIV